MLLKRSSASVCFESCDEQRLTFWNYGLGSLVCARRCWTETGEEEHVKSLRNEGLLIFPTKGRHWKEKKPVAWWLGVYCCKHMCLSFSICQIRASSLHEMCLEILSVKNCSKAWGDTWLCPGNTWELRKCPLENEGKFACLQESGCAFPEKIS